MVQTLGPISELVCAFLGDLGRRISLLTGDDRERMFCISEIQSLFSALMSFVYTTVFCILPSTEYNDLKREVQNALRKDKQEWLEEKCTEVEKMNRRHNTSGVYKTIKEITGKRGMRQMGIKDKDGKILTDGEQVLNRWKTHTENMYSQTTIFWPHYSGKCRTVGTYSPRRNHGRVTASRQTENTVDTRH